MRAAGVDHRLEWSQFYQGLTQGDGDKTWEYAGKWDAQARLDLGNLGLWHGLSVTAQGYFNYGHSVNGTAGTAIPVTVALFVPGIEGADASDVVALYLTQHAGDLVSVTLGKLNALEFARGRPIVGGGIDTFWNTEIAAPITGNFPPTLVGAQVNVETQPVSFSVTVFDPEDATNRLFSHLFENGVSVMGTATLKTELAGRTGYYGIKGIYSTREGADLSQIIPPFGVPRGILTQQGSYYVSLSMQQYLVQDLGNPARGWGVFGELAKGDGNPNLLDWSVYGGVGGSSLIPGRPDDRFSIGYFYYGLSDPLQTSLAPVFNFTNESGLEVFCNVAVTPWFGVTGDVQFIRPAARDFSRAIFVGLGTYVRF